MMNTRTLLCSEIVTIVESGSMLIDRLAQEASHGL